MSHYFFLYSQSNFLSCVKPAATFETCLRPGTGNKHLQSLSPLKRKKHCES